MIRVYAPECREASVWENLLQAGVSNNMGIIVQVWWGFDSVGNTCSAIALANVTAHRIKIFGSRPNPRFTTS